jgi:hypothetical protein
MHWCHREPTLKDMLSDSIVRALMAADGVNAHELETMLMQIGRNSGPVIGCHSGAPLQRRARNDGTIRQSHHTSYFAAQNACFRDCGR